MAFLVGLVAEAGTAVAASGLEAAGVAGAEVAGAEVAEEAVAAVACRQLRWTVAEDASIMMVQMQWLRTSL